MLKKLASQNKDLWQLSLSGFILYAPISIFAYPVSVLVVNPESSVFLLILCGFLITVATFVPYLLSVKLLQQFSTLKSAYLISNFLLIITLTGAFRGVVFYYVNVVLGLTQSGSLINRILASTFTTIFWLCASNIIINASRSFKRTYQSALNQFLAAHVEVFAQKTNTATENPELVEFEKDLSKSLSELLGNSDSETFRKVSQSLTVLINEHLRPLSRRIWLRSLSEYPVINYKRLLGDSLKLLNFSQIGFIGIMSVLALLNNLFLRKLDESFWRSFSYLCMTLTLMFFFNKSRNHWQRISLNFSFLLIISFAPIFISEFFADLLGYQTNYLAALLITPIPAAVIIVLALFDLTQRDRLFLLSLLDNNTKIIFDSVSAGVDLEQRQIASYLHNSFQSELLALSSQLAAAALSGDKESTSSVLQRASAVAARSLSEDLARMKEQPLDRLDSVINSWKNILEIEVDISNEVLQEKCNTVVFTQTVEEIASNAFRHDKATKLVISAKSGEFGTRLLFQSNGSQPISKSEGMGDSWLNQVSITPYSIEKNELGTIIEVEI